MEWSLFSVQKPVQRMDSQVGSTPSLRDLACCHVAERWADHERMGREVLTQRSSSTATVRLCYSHSILYSPKQLFPACGRMLQRRPNTRELQVELTASHRYARFSRSRRSQLDTAESHNLNGVEHGLMVKHDHRFDSDSPSSRYASRYSRSRHLNPTLHASDPSKKF